MLPNFRIKTNTNEIKRAVVMTLERATKLVDDFMKAIMDYDGRDSMTKTRIELARLNLIRALAQAQDKHE